jgi:hypothetical protein
VRDRLHDVRARDEHVRRAAHHEREVGDRRGVDGAARAGPEDGRDLGDDAGGEGVAEEDVGVAAERDDALLNAGAARVVQADHGGAVADREVHDLADLLRERLGERAAEDREVLREDVHQPAVDPSVAGDHAVTVHLLLLETEVRRPVRDEAVELDEGPVVEQEVEALAGRQLSLLVLRLHARRPAPLLRLGAPALEQLQLLSHGHKAGKVARGVLGF